jgi:hypothetical protein
MAKEFKHKKYNFIFEQTNIVSHNDIEILEEQKFSGGSGKIFASVRLQESEIKNNNGRYYSKPICESIVSQLSPKATGRSLLMEIDHPLFISADPNVLKRRASIIEINNCGALLRNVKLIDNEIIGEFETLSGFKGPDVYNLIMKDKVDIGFSLRALGAVETLQDGTIMVKDPIRPITYDIVSNPSHANARVLEFLPESAQEFVPERNVIYENSDLDLLMSDQVNVIVNNSNVLKFIDDIINERFMEVASKKIRFRI